MKYLVRLIACTTFIGIGFANHSRLLAGDGADAKAIAYFETHIRPLLASRCYSCHSARLGNDEGSLVLDTRDGWMRGGDQGPTIVPGDADASLLIRAVRYSDPDMQMPPDNALPAASIAHLERWVEIGAPDPREPKSETEANVFVPSDPIAGRRHWAYQPLQQVPPEQIVSVAERSESWSRGAIDRFVIAKLNAANLTPAARCRPFDVGSSSLHSARGVTADSAATRRFLVRWKARRGGTASGSLAGIAPVWSALGTTLVGLGTVCRFQRTGRKLLVSRSMAISQPGHRFVQLGYATGSISARANCR